jgi:hypothetical protein
MSNIGGRLSVRKRKWRDLHYFHFHPLGVSLGMLLRNKTTMLEVMTTCIQYGPHSGRKETKMCQISPMSSIPCTPRYVSNIMSDVWCKSIVVFYIDTSKNKWSFWTYHSLEWPIDIFSKLSRSLNKRGAILGLGTPHRKRRERESKTCRTKDRENMGTSGQPVQAIRK